MSLLQDVKHDTLRTQLGLEGHVNDLEHDWLVALGATPGQALVDMWSEVFDAAAIPAGQFNDRAVAYILATLTPPSSLGSYNNHWLYYWQNVTLGPPAPMPPNPAALTHWFDFSDASTVWQDVAGTIPAADGTDIRRIDNKGTDGTPLTHAGANQPTYRTGILNGQNIGDFSVTGTRRLEANPAAGLDPSTNGITMAAIVRENNLSFAGNNFFSVGGAHAIRWEPAGPGSIASGTTGPGVRSILGTPMRNQWYLVYFSYEVAGSTNDFDYHSPGPEQANIGTPVASIPGGYLLQMLFGTGEGDVAEAFYWDGDLSLAERAALETYAEAKYGALPTQPPAEVGCAFPSNYFEAVLSSAPFLYWPLDDPGPAGPSTMRELIQIAPGTYVGAGIGFQNVGPFGIGDCSAGQSPPAGESYQAAANGTLDSLMGSFREFTFEVWVRIQNTALNTAIFGKPDGIGGSINATLFIPGSPVNRYRWRLDDGGANTLSLNSSAPGNDGVWRHIVGMRCLTSGVHAADESRLYVNGVLDASAAYSGTASLNHSDIVRFSDRAGIGTQGSLNGDVAHGAIYLRALSDAEVLNHYTVGTTSP